MGETRILIVCDAILSYDAQLDFGAADVACVINFDVPKEMRLQSQFERSMAEQHMQALEDGRDCHCAACNLERVNSGITPVINNLFPNWTSGSGPCDICGEKLD